MCSAATPGSRFHICSTKSAVPANSPLQIKPSAAADRNSLFPNPSHRKAPQLRQSRHGLQRLAEGLPPHSPRRADPATLLRAPRAPPHLKVTRDPARETARSHRGGGCRVPPGSRRARPQPLHVAESHGRLWARKARGDIRLGQAREARLAPRPPPRRSPAHTLTWRKGGGGRRAFTCGLPPF